MRGTFKSLILTCRFENKKSKNLIRTIRTNRTLALIYKACVLYGRSEFCTVDVRMEQVVCNVEALIYKDFVRIVRIVRKFLYTHIYSNKNFQKNAVKRPRARKDVYIDRTNRTNRTLPLIFKASVLYGWQNRPYKIGSDRTK